MNAVSSISKHTAAGQYLGYALQPVRLCFHLLTSPPGALVSMEHLDDVAVEGAGQTLLEQTKSATSQNPLSDWATDLWKTLDYWITGIEAGELDFETTRFRYYVTPPKAGDFAETLSQAKTAEEIDALIVDLQLRLSKQAKPPACAEHVQHLLAMDATRRAAFVSALEVISVDDDPVEPIRDLFRLTVSPVILDPICHWAIGAAKEAADRLIRKKQPAILSADQFRAEVVAFVQRNNLPGLLDKETDLLLKNWTDLS